MSDGLMGDAGKITVGTLGGSHPAIGIEMITGGAGNVTGDLKKEGAKK